MSQKSLVVPKCSRFTMDFPFSSLRAGGNISRVRLLHMRDEPDAFVCGEKRSTQNTPSNAVVTQVFCTSTEAVYYNQTNSTMNFCYYTRTVTGISNPKCLIEFNEQNGTQRTLLICNSRMHLLDPGYSTTYTTVSTTGGDCAAVHYERIFIGKATTLHYSEPMKVDTLNQPSTYGYGNIRLPDGRGNIMGIASLRGKLYLFRQYGITAITAFADPLNFKVENLHYDSGRILANSVVKCGNVVCFLTDNGLWIFDGTSCKHAANANDEDIDLLFAITGSTCFQNRYFAAVKLNSGKYGIYSYNLKSELGRYLFYECNSITANANVIYFSCNDLKNQLFKLSDKSFGPNGECELEVKFTAGDKDKGDFYAEYVAVKGTGEISLSLENEYGGKVSVTGKCGETIRLPRALRGGEYTLKIRPADTGFRIEALSFGMRRDFYDD